MTDLQRLQSLSSVLRGGYLSEQVDVFALLVCPVCAMQFNHVGDAVRQSGDDDYQAWRGRGDLLVLPVYAECTSEWDICFGFHKGESYTYVRVRKACSDESYLYFVEAIGTGMIKIGRSANPERRLGQLSTGSPVELTIVARLGGGADLEREMHARFAHLRSRGEWFTATDELRAFIRRSTV